MGKRGNRGKKGGKSGVTTVKNRVEIGWKRGEKLEKDGEKGERGKT